MKEIVRYGFILAVICIVVSGLLAAVYSITKPRIIAQARQEEENSLKEVMPTGEKFTPVKKQDEVLYYKVSDKDDKFIGVAFKAAADGYSSTIETMVGMTDDGTITAIKILSQNETPGIGMRITEPSFTSQFRNKNIQNLNEVQAITGATISSTAVIDAVKEKAKKIKGLLNSHL